jgi:predicted oxidoreductase (fatty acid repression mutant protein)
MKKRFGFVSNSSSSSFVMLIKPEEHERVMKELHPYVKAVVEAVTWETEIFGQKVVMHQDLKERDYGSIAFFDLEVEYDGEIPEKYAEEPDPYEAWYDYSSKLNPEHVFRSRIDG